MKDYWYKDAVFYELYIRGFQDSNGDGKGDIPGLTSRLGYLRELGVDCIWLLPMYPSPGHDDGYDIQDYKGINPEYGTLEDFKFFLDEAHMRGIRVIADLVLNHTSDRHPWFIDARKGPSSPYHDYYVWSDDPGKYSGASIIFINHETSNWAWCPDCGSYYWHRFFSHQPDLNYRNPKVQEEMIDVIRFWLDMGLDGFRMDAVPYLFEREGTNCEGLPETHAYLKRIRAMLDEKYPDAVMIAEANQWPEDLRQYFGDGDEMHMAFNFPLMPRLFMAVKQEHHGPIVDIVKRTPVLPENCQWATFLRNHDELTLAMCTDEERDYMYNEYAKDPQMKLYSGIRRRLVPLLEKNYRKVELLNVLLFPLPGSPVIYYGDEIGMGDNIFLGDRNGVRTPMHWNDNRNAGFSACNPSRLYAPVITDADYSYTSVNVQVEEMIPNSLLNWMKKMIRVRRKYKSFSRGALRFIYPENKKVLVYALEYDGEQMLCVFNLASSSQPVQIGLREFNGCGLTEVIGDTEFPQIGDSDYQVTLGPYGYYLLEIKH
ncbi:MAG: maltose alpha-D-glucosyltransferase [Spirochaetes bacterium GWF1_49_6]|nr:MAG: maltose alpha-D-glucosyltransferase [Spirochaetes bacterium GWF1_49_6]